MFIEMSDHAEGKRLTEWKEQLLIEAAELPLWNDSRVAAVRLTWQLYDLRASG